MGSDDLTEHCDNFYLQQVANVAQRYRYLADDIERLGSRVSVRNMQKFDDQVSYMDAATKVVKAIMVTGMNSGIEGLLSAAADADYDLRMPEGGDSE